MASDTPQFPRPDLAEIRRQLKDLDAADEEIRLALRAGIDVAEQGAQAAELRKKLLQIRQTYYPGQS
jgi:t-SNARE complex subunit (syntaxin)